MCDNCLPLSRLPGPSTSPHPLPQLLKAPFKAEVAGNKNKTNPTNKQNKQSTHRFDFPSLFQLTDMDILNSFQKKKGGHTYTLGHKFIWKAAVTGRVDCQLDGLWSHQGEELLGSPVGSIQTKVRL